MYKKRMAYDDFDGNKREEDFYFNLTQKEVLDFEVSNEGGLEKTVKQIVDTQDREKLIKLFEKLIAISYGEKSLDGKRFVKSPEVLDAFMQTQAYSDLFMELATNAESASEFVNGIIPKTNK